MITICVDHNVSPNEVNKRDNAKWICNALGKGLVVWEDTETYEDMKSIASDDVFDKPIWTALNNMGEENCDGASACDGKLVIMSKRLKLLEYSKDKFLLSVMAADTKWTNRDILSQF